MRTTLKIDDDILAAARSLAAEHGRTVGEVVSELARRGLSPRDHGSSASGIPVFTVSPNASRLTAEMVREAHEDA